MPLNPAVKPEALNSPVERANRLNDPQFENQQGYFPYDLTHQEFITPLFGQITPTMHLDTVPGDRTVVHDNSKVILNQINGNFLSNLNQYVDSFYVPLRSVFPMNYEKLIPNPVKGDDLPNSALPQVPFAAFILDYLRSNREIDLGDGTNTSSAEIFNSLGISSFWNDATPEMIGFAIGRLALLATVLSRGQLLDYLGIGYDTIANDLATSDLQYKIDQFFDDLYALRDDYLYDGYMTGIELDLRSNVTDLRFGDSKSYKADTLSLWRSALSNLFEGGYFPLFKVSYGGELSTAKERFRESFINLYRAISVIFADFAIEDKESYLQDIDFQSNPYGNGGYLNIGKILAYQQIVAHYYTNDSVDNIFSSDLYMQLLRSVMYPGDESRLSLEPVFDYNGVATEYDYISCGGFFTSLISDTIIGTTNRQFVWLTLVMLLRRSLRYGDYFSTSRPNMLAVGQLGINVEDGMVSPIDVTKNLLMQRYLNAANYIGQGFLQFMTSIYGVRPSDTGTFPRFITHRKIVLQNQITNNTADDQGKQTTNIVGFTDDSAFDVFIDDFGYLISLTSFDVLPVYTSGIDSSYHFSDRFDYFNPMLQNVGDQPIVASEILGHPGLQNTVFGYTMRNSEYKYKLSKVHGAFVNNLPGFMLRYPLRGYRAGLQDVFEENINPDFIRDKPMYLDPVIPQMTGTSPGNYYHFIVSCTNQVQCARKIQATPPVLF